MIFRNLNLNRVFPSVLAIGSILGATAAQAQVTSGSITTPAALAGAFIGGPGAGSVTVTSSGGGLGTLTATPFALPAFGTPINIQFTATNDLFQFNNLPASGTGIVTGLNSTVNFVVNPGAVAIGPLNFTTEYSYDADATVVGLDGTRVTYNPTTTQTFSFGGSLYQVNIGATQASSQGTPTSLSNNSIGGTITNLTNVAPEPGTLAFIALGGTLVLVRRRKH
ncbi:PEP-CTERM sorting domain-containing protein [Armatimonas sp.]|uniref:PEP-CTERM sorting domain-containing protein n=1 Tax=Armatimonas sp. TaxID=1872638 RepID=UPI0037521D3F